VDNATIMKSGANQVVYFPVFVGVGTKRAFKQIQGIFEFIALRKEKVRREGSCVNNQQRILELNFLTER